MTDRSRQKVLVTGAAGQLGARIVREFERDHDVVPLARADLDLREGPAILAAVRRIRPTVIINCAAYNRVDAAEDDPLPALDLNAFAVRVLARAASDAGACLVHYSTDFVFDGSATRPYAETDPARPLSFYAASKLLGEWFALEHPMTYVLRVESLFGGGAARSSVDRIGEAIRAGREAVVFCDRTVSPSFVDDVARATRRVVEDAIPSGLYHCVNSGYATWYEVAREIGRQLGCQPRLRPISVEEMPLPAARPRFAALSNAKLRAVGIDMPSWQDGIRRWLGAGDR